MTQPVFAEMFALAQCVPGPSSTQLAYGIGIIKKGVAGGMLSGFLFQFPGLLLMSLVGVGVAEFLKAPSPALRGAVAGLGAAGVALVAQSAVALTRGVCKDNVGLLLAATTATITFYVVRIWLFPLLIALGGIVTLIQLRKCDMASTAADVHVERFGLKRWAGLGVVGVWLAVLVGTIVAGRLVPAGTCLPLDWWRTFYLSGSYIFGGGQVVIPMLYDQTVTRDCAPPPPGGGLPTCVDAPTTWVTTADFYTGLAVVQAMPGPLFNFAPYLGAVAARRAGVHPLVGIAVGWVGLNAPGILLYYGLLPWWGAVRHANVYRRALPGLNAAAVGLVTAAALTLTIALRSQSPFPDATIAIGMVVYTATGVLRVPVPAAVVGGGVLGVVAWAAKMH
jgi:chromate transporter